MSFSNELNTLYKTIEHDISNIKSQINQEDIKKEEDINVEVLKSFKVKIQNIDKNLNEIEKIKDRLKSENEKKYVDNKVIEYNYLV